eukprot:1155681-Pelagomonas_calceolata.AAC.6
MANQGLLNQPDPKQSMPVFNQEPKHGDGLQLPVEGYQSFFLEIFCFCIINPHLLPCYNVLTKYQNARALQGQNLRTRAPAKCAEHIRGLVGFQGVLHPGSY